MTAREGTDADCSKCAGMGQRIKRVNYRRNGTISSITFDLKTQCTDCGGTGLAVMEKKT